MERARKPASILIVFVALIIALATAGQALAQSFGEWQAVKAVSARFNSFEQAQKAGYSIAGEPCVAAPPGAMGIHAVNRDLAGDLAIDALQPEILLYLPKEDGSLRLIGLEYFSVALANSDTGPVPWFADAPPPNGWFNPAPTVFGRTFDGPMPGHNPSMPWHYDLHVWLWASNPSGTFAMFNPSLSCPGG
jgi:hypothetical protein